MSLCWIEGQLTLNGKCTALFGKKPCVASASLAVSLNGWADRAPMDGWRGLKIPRCSGIREGLKRRRSAYAREAFAPALAESRTLPKKEEGRRLPPSFPYRNGPESLLFQIDSRSFSKLPSYGPQKSSTQTFPNLVLEDIHDSYYL